MAPVMMVGSVAAIGIVLLGGFRIVADGRAIVEGDWRRRKAAALVKLLALAPRQQLHREQLLDILWPDLDPEAAANNLRQALHAARRALDTLLPGGGTLLVVRGERLGFNPDRPCSIDLLVFEQATAEARRTGQIADYEVAIARYAGELLPDDRYEDWAASRRESVRALFVDLLLAVAGRYEAVGDRRMAIAALERVVDADPAHEAARAGLMRLYTLDGQRQQGLRQFAQLRDALRHDLDVEPAAETQRLYHQILSHHFPAAASAQSLLAHTGGASARASPPADLPGDNLPLALTSLIGREQALVELAVQLASARLLTLTGPGGSGKTRLALALATAQVGQYPDGVWLVELVPVADPALIPSAVAGVLEVAEVAGAALTTTLAAALRPKRLLLVLDNCEHLTAACAALVGTLLSAAPGLRVLATSREALRVPGEITWAVPPLHPPATGLTPESAGRNEAVRLFVERARLAKPAFTLTTTNTSAVSEICRRLDGIPLALELAATRLSLLTVEELAGRLDDALDLLTGGGRVVPDRQRTLRATLDWSYALLDTPEQALLRRLAPFAGGWTIEAAEAMVASAGPGYDHEGTFPGLSRGPAAQGGARHAPQTNALDLLAGLVDKSLVQVEAVGDETRYRLLETVRHYCWERLEEQGETTAARTRHAAFYAMLAERADRELRGPRQVWWFDRLEREHATLRVALRWASAGDDAALGLRLGGGLWWFWYIRGYFTEGSAHLRELLGRPGADRPSSLRAAVALGAGALLWRLTNYPAARAYCEESLTIARTLGDHRATAWALAFLAHITGSQGEFDLARACGEEGLALFRAVGDKVGMARTLNGLAEDARVRSEYDRAAAYYEEALALDREVGNTAGVALRLHNLTFTALHQGRLRQAAAYLQESFQLHSQLGVNTRHTSYVEGMAAVAAAAGQAKRAASLYGAHQALALSLGYRNELDPSDQAEYDRHLATARAALPEKDFTVAWALGRALPLDAVLAEATAVIAALDNPAPPVAPVAHLSPREREVAALLVSGQTNLQIAVALGMARRTVDTHVAAILRKLGLDSRADVADRLFDH